MIKLPVAFIFTGVVLCTFVLSVYCKLPGRLDDERHFSEWGYKGDDGPKHWHELDEKFKVCKAGLHQSPIDINSDEIKTLSNLNYDYQFSAIDVLNNGHTIEFDYEPGSWFSFNGKKYELVQFHFHSPSEHRVDGKKFPMEIHLVHRDDKNNFLVVGIFVQEGNENIFADNLWAHFPKEKEEHHKFKYEKINIAGLFPENQKAYYYSGSLTTPPCTEKVNWIIFQEPVEMSKKQLGHFHKFYNFNARPIQHAGNN